MFERSSFRTERLHLRPIRPEDGAALFPLIDNWNVARWLGAVPWPYMRADMQHFITHIAAPRTASRYPVFCILADGALIGVAECRGEQNARRNDDYVSELGYWIGQPYWGNGYATEAAAGLIAQVFEDPEVPFIRSGVFDGNTASLNVQRKLGFEVTGTVSTFCRPHGRELPLTATRLDRSRFKPVAPRDR